LRGLGRAGRWIRAKVISIDSRLTFFASRADKWLQLRPYAVGALAMGFLGVIISDDLYDWAFV